MKFKTAGYSETNHLTFEPGPSRCGKIKDGVVFSHDNRGNWLIAFKDLEKMYLAAKAERQLIAQQRGAITSGPGAAMCGSSQFAASSEER
jgi:hypothetical protein